MIGGWIAFAGIVIILYIMFSPDDDDDIDYY